MPEIFGLLFPLVLMAVVFYFLLIRPQQKRQKEIGQMHADMKKGDKIVTIGGLHGTIDTLAEDHIQIDVGGGQKLTYERAAVKHVVVDEQVTTQTED